MSDTRAWVQMLRPALAPTAAADVLAGAAFAGGAAPGPLALAVAGSVCLYAGGMLQNDLCDRERDAKLQADRPLVREPRLVKPALLVALGLHLGGFALVAAAGAWIPGLLVLIAANAYNLGLKARFPGDALTLGAARAANLSIGMVLAGGLPAGAAWLYLGAYLVYIGATTTASRAEDLTTPETRRLTLLLAHVVQLMAFGALALLAARAAWAWGWLLPAGLLVTAVVGAVRSGTRTGAKRYILRSLQAIFLLHLIVLGSRGLSDAMLGPLVCAAASFLLLAALAPRHEAAGGD